MKNVATDDVGHTPERWTKSDKRALNDLIRSELRSATTAERAIRRFKLSGRGHECRITVCRSLAAVLRNTDLPFVYIAGFGANTHYPERVFSRAIAQLEALLGEAPIKNDGCCAWHLGYESPALLTSLRRLRDNRSKKNIPKSCMQLVYRLAPHNEGVAFISPERAAYIDKIYDGINNAKTWGELRNRVPQPEHAFLENIYEETNTSGPADDESANLSIEQFEGDYPPWIQQEQDQHLPPEILEKYATRLDSVHNGAFWLIPRGQLSNVINDLRNLGYTVQEETKLYFQ